MNDIDLIKELRLIQDWIEENTSICSCSVSLKFDGNEIEIEISVRCAWDILIDLKKYLNACDWKTNINGAIEFVSNFDYKKYKNVTDENLQSFVEL
jgi:hypothetical protein